jgi:hypothetical protein
LVLKKNPNYFDDNWQKSQKIMTITLTPEAFYIFQRSWQSLRSVRNWAADCSVAISGNFTKQSYFGRSFSKNQVFERPPDVSASQSLIIHWWNNLFMRIMYVWHSVCALCTADNAILPWSQFSAIFANFLQIKLAFSQKPMLWSKCLHNLALLWVKNSNLFAIVSAKIFKKS